MNPVAEIRASDYGSNQHRDQYQREPDVLAFASASMRIIHFWVALSGVESATI
jgi:hypothetical protein